MNRINASFAIDGVIAKSIFLTSLSIINFCKESITSWSNSSITNKSYYGGTSVSGTRNIGGLVGSDYLDAASDDAISINVSDPDVYKLAMGRYTASTRVESDMRWKEYYSLL